MAKIPFSWMPGHWGLKGKSRELARAEYELSGEDLERRLIEINYDEVEQLAQFLKLDRKHNRISKEEYDYKLVDIKFESKLDRDLAKLKLDKKYGKITENDYNKQLANINGEPWVAVINSEYKPEQLSDGFSFELDWNDEFVHMLRANGYNGNTPEEVVEQWFDDISVREYINIYGELLNEVQEEDPDERVRTTQENLGDGRRRHS